MNGIRPHRKCLAEQAAEMRTEKERVANFEEYGIHESDWERKLRIENETKIQELSKEFRDVLIQQYHDNEFIDWGIVEIELVKFLLEYKQELIFFGEINC